jgi:shikimate 5-dehydrogenase
VGMHPRTEESPVDKEALINYRLIVDVIYNPLRTKLLRDAEMMGKMARSGVGMFVHQGADQIRIWTGVEPPRMLMKQAVIESLRKKHGN